MHTDMATMWDMPDADLPFSLLVEVVTAAVVSLGPLTLRNHAYRQRYCTPAGCCVPRRAALRRTQCWGARGCTLGEARRIEACLPALAGSRYTELAGTVAVLSNSGSGKCPGAQP